jgi:two-component system sensor histidine kinase ChiS
MILDLRKSDLNKLINSIIEECGSLYLNDKNLQINFNPDKIFRGVFDQERIGQVLRNLLINAIRFSANNKSIEVTVCNSEIEYSSTKKEKAVLVSVIDQGVGVPKEELESIFLPFVQSKRTKTKAGGTGLGLSISREIIEAHNGKIWARNNEKKGACFCFLIPIMPKGTKNIEEENTPTPMVSHDKKVILVVDDEESCLMSVDLLLRGTGYILLKAKNGHEALEFLNSGQSIDLIMLDLMMPDMYGLNVLEKIDPINSKIPVILQSGSSDEQEIKKAFSMGVVDYIRKPYEKNSLLSKIRKHIGYFKR